jgi:geranylgeranyl diphosphate synthase type I
VTFSPAQQPEFTSALDTALTGFLDEQLAVVRSISPDAAELLSSIADLTRGGKRLRPLFAFWGAQAAGGDVAEESIVGLGAALELFQAAALIHDDIIDHSDTRRGAPSVHRRFEASHRAGGWDLDPADFGLAAAVLAGDLALSLSEQAFAACVPAPRARALFDAMRLQVMAGQYLDVLEEQIGGARDPERAVEAARTVVRYKSAKYSVENPVLLGAAQAGASEELLAGLSAFALPLGEAFQLRDDDLGVFGDPEATGKPAGDDLREGKRTVLVALTLRRADAAGRVALLDALGDPALDEDGVRAARAAMIDSGARAEHEGIIEQLTRTAFEALDALPVPDAAREGLRSAGLAAVRRRA